MFPVANPGTQARFLPMISSWGWATWGRAWRYFDPDLGGLGDVLENPAVRQRFDLDDSYPYSWLLAELRAGRVDSWAVAWYLAVFRQQGLTLFPSRSLVRNTGWDGSGIHCTQSGAFDTALAERMDARFPDTVEVSTPVLAKVKHFLRNVGHAASVPELSSTSEACSTAGAR